MAGMRNGWEAPRTHVGPYVQGQNAGILMGGLAGSDAARHRFEAATTAAETEAVSADLLTKPGQHLGDPIDYGAYLIGQLTGSWKSPTGYVPNDHSPVARLQPRLRSRLRVPVLGLHAPRAEPARHARPPARHDRGPTSGAARRRS